MNKIGFKNFRQFSEFLPIELGQVTFLVGRNNSGKSTLVKAILLIINFLDSKKINRFSFGNNLLKDANIVTYGRAKNRENPDIDFIEFKFSFKEYFLTLKVTASDDNKTIAEVYEFVIFDDINDIVFIFKNNELAIQGLKKSVLYNAQSNEITNLENIIKDLKNTIKRSNLKKGSKEHIELIDKLQEVQKKRKYVIDNLVNENDIDSNGDEEHVRNKDFGIIGDYDEFQEVEDIVMDFIEQTVDEFKNEDRQVAYENIKSEAFEDTRSESFEDLRAFAAAEFQITRSFKKFQNYINKERYFYLGANLTKQNALLSIRDIDNALAQAVHEYYELRILKGQYPYLFITKWMRAFGVGTDFSIEIRAGEAYEVKITSITGNAVVHLADKGMGSIQVMLLLFKIAVIIRKDNLYEKISTIIIEEPELNLHPALQSLLADFFLTVYEQYKIKFIIETHSEYLIRRTQLLVKENEFEVKPNENPFSVIYFDRETQKCWNMIYRSDGKFENEFGKGFYDESANLTIDLL